MTKQRFPATEQLEAARSNAKLKAELFRRLDHAEEHAGYVREAGPTRRTEVAFAYLARLFENCIPLLPADLTEAATHYLEVVEAAKDSR